MAKKHLFTVAVIICFPVFAAMLQRHPDAASSSSQPKWEYGFYRVSASKHRYEWIHNAKRVYAQNQGDFSSKLGAPKLRAKMLDKYIPSSGSLPEYLVDSQFINYFGGQGWELIDIGSIGRGRVATFKRVKNDG